MPQKIMDEIFTYLEVESIKIEQKIVENINEKYFLEWKKEKSSMSENELNNMYVKFEERVNNLGYSLKEI